jgi:hypothetical protein
MELIAQKAASVLPDCLIRYSGGASGGRGTVRYMFAHPELFCSAAPGGSGFGAERAQSMNGGVETSSFEPPLASMSSRNRATTLTLQKPAPRPGSDALNGETDLEVRIN